MSDASSTLPYFFSREATERRDLAWVAACIEKYSRGPVKRAAGVAVARAASARRRGRQRDALCACCRPQQFRDIYSEARAQWLEVDHVVPLYRGGKHCVKNLQLLSPEEHKIKTGLDRRLLR